LFTWGVYYQYDLDDLRCVFFGEFGDTFGILNTLFSAFAMSFAGYAIFIQSKELKAQKEELKLSRLEFEVTRATNVLFKQSERVNDQIKLNATDKFLTEHVIQDIDSVIENIGDINSESHMKSALKKTQLPRLNNWLNDISQSMYGIANVIRLFYEFKENLEKQKDTENNDHIEKQVKDLSKIIHYNTPHLYTDIASAFAIEHDLKEVMKFRKDENHLFDKNAVSCYYDMIKIESFFYEFPKDVELYEQFKRDTAQ